MASPTVSAIGRVSGETAIVAISSAEATYVTESTQNATGSWSWSSATNRPASAKPATSANVSPTHRAEFAGIRSSGATMRGRIAPFAGRKKIETVVMRNTSG